MRAYQVLSVVAIALVVFAFVPLLGALALTGADPDLRGARQCLRALWALAAASVVVEVVAWLV